MQRIVSVSIPRSGHHLVTRILWSYFRFGEYLYCETYYGANDQQCCGQIPCARVMERASEAFGDSSALQLFMQKSHDLDNELAFEGDKDYLVQLRDPAQSAVGWLRWQILQGNNLTVGEITSSLVGFVLYYIRFYHKWCVSHGECRAADNVFLLEYEDLFASEGAARRAIRSLIEWSGILVDSERLDDAIRESMSIDAHSGMVVDPGETAHAIEEYDALTGGLFEYVLARLEAYCPGAPRHSAGGSHQHRTSLYVGLFYFAILREVPRFAVDFADTTRVLAPSSPVVRSGPPHMLSQLGLSFAEAGQGAWTDGEVAMFPVAIDPRATRVSIEVDYAPSRPSQMASIECAYIVYARRVIKGVQSHHDEPTFRTFSLSCPLDVAHDGDSSEFLFVLRIRDIRKVAGEVRRLGLHLRAIRIELDIGQSAPRDHDSSDQARTDV